MAGTDPALSCGDGVVDNSVWFILQAVSNGNATVTVTNINNNPGLDMEIYTGTCGALVSTGNCASGSSGTGGTMSINFAVTGGTTYYIMVDGNTGNQEAFDITATTPDNAIVARPDADFNPSTLSGCVPLVVSFTDNTTLHGGSNITYEWRVDGGAWTPAPALVDTTITFAAIGTHSVDLRVCNDECGCKTVSQDIVAQDLFPTIGFLPNPACVGTEIFFDGNATIQPDPPFVDPSITSWDWDFGDPASGPNNTASGQNVSHTFTNSSTSYTVALTVQGYCGPKVVNTNVNLLPKPTVEITGASDVCEGTDLNLGSTITNATPPITYDWVGAGIFSCTNCDTTSVSGLPPGGPYNITLSIIDSLGCAADTFVDVNVNELPTVFAGGFITVCPSDSAVLNAAPAGGLAPYSYQWTPSAGLSSDTVFDPYTFNTNSQVYCVTVTDDNGCESNPDCVTIDQYPIPTITPASANLCLTQPPLQNTFTVNGAAPGSAYEWGLSADYALITGAAGDSSSIDVTFPPDTGTYSFTVIVSDAVTGCVDTVSTSFTVDSGLNMSVTGPALICEGDSATLTVSGADTYEWSASPAYVFADSSLATQTVAPVVNTVFTILGTQGTCTQSFDYNLDVNPKPTADVAPIPPICGCDTVTLDGSLSSAGMAYMWTSLNGNTISSPTSQVTTAIVCGNDSMTLTVTDTTTGCSETATTAVDSRPKPDATVSVSPNLICDGVATVITLDGTGSNADPGTTYHWTSNNGATITDTTVISTTSTVSVATVFMLTVTDSVGCDSTASDAVSIHPPPTISATMPFLCVTDTVQMSTITISGASSGSNYNWTTIPGCVVPAATTLDSETFDFIACGVGSYDFDITVTDSATTCVTNLTQNVTVVGGVVLTVSPDTSFCEGGVATLAASGANTYLWSTTDTTDTINVPGLTAAGSPYTYSVTGTIGTCTASDSVEVTVNPIPATAFTVADSTVCENDPASVYSVINNPGSTYNWNITNGIILVGQGTADVIVTWNAPGVGQLTVVETNSFGCDGSMLTVNVIISPLPPAPTVSGNDTVCEGATEIYFVNPTAGSTFTWAITGGSFLQGPTGVTNRFQWGAPGNGSLDVYETTSAGCVGPTATFNVLINPSPSPVAVSGSTQVCDNAIEIYTAPPPDSIYTWTVSNSLQDSLNATTDTMTIDWDSGSTFGLITVFETNSFGCNSDTATLNITISQHPTVNIPNSIDTVCNNTTYQLVANVTGSGNLQWTTTGTGTFSNDTIASPVYTPSPADTGDIFLSLVSSAAPCANDSSAMTLHFLPSPTVSISGPASPICYGSTDTLTATGTGGSNYIWTPGGIPNDSIIISPITTTTYTVTVISAGCTAFDTLTVDVIPAGVGTAGPDEIACVGDTVSITGSQQNATGLIWTTSGDGTFHPDNVTPNAFYVGGPGDTTAGAVTIYVTSTGACANLSDTMEITYQYQATIQAGNDTTITSDPSAGATLLLSPTGTNLANVIWTTSGSGTFDPSDTTLNAVYVPSAADFAMDQVTLIVQTIGSCIPVSDTLVLDFSPFIIPNVFTPYPTSPGQNDYFRIQYLTPNVGLKIWDRWGHLVYTSDYYQNDWDAHGLKADVYYYMVFAGNKSYRGWVEVIRSE